MTFYISSYQPFQNTRNLIADIKEKFQTFPLQAALNVAKKVVSIVFSIFMFLPFLFIDIFCTSLSLYLKPKIKPVSRVDTTASSKDQIFFVEAIQIGFRLLTIATAIRYSDLISNDGLSSLPGNGESAVEIFKWTAGCMIIHYIRLKPRPKDIFLQKRTEINNLLDSYDQMNVEDRNKVIKKISIPEDPCELDGATQSLTSQIQALALSLTQDSHFMHKIYWPCKRKIVLNLEAKPPT